MPEYIYLLENRLSAAQQSALKQVREAAREAGMTVFLTGGAVRDLTTGSSVRDFDFAVQGNALHLEEALIARGAALWGKHEPTRTLFLWFPGSVRVEITTSRSEEYPKPGQPVYHWGTIIDDLRRRDFTANAMAISLNEGSFGLLLDPLNGVADIEARLLRLASNYGFIEDPARLVRATRLHSRLGWELEEKTRTRYENAKEADSIGALTDYRRGYELEKIAGEEEPLKVIKALEAEGWMKHLDAAWTSAVADVAGLEALHRNLIQLMIQGVMPDRAAAQLELLTAKMQPKELDALKKHMVRPGLVRQWEGLEENAKEFARLLTGREASSASAAFKLLMTHPAEAVLWLAHTRKGGAVDTKFKNFFTVWPDFRKKVPAAMMLEMRITPELPGYPELLDELFYQLIDGKLETDEAMRAFLEPYSPPAPPPPPVVRRTRAKKADPKSKRKAATLDDDDEDDDSDDDDEDGDEIDVDVEVEDDIDLDLDDADTDSEPDTDPDGDGPKKSSKSKSDDEDDLDDDDEDEAKPSPKKSTKTATKTAKPAPAPKKAPAKAVTVAAEDSAATVPTEKSKAAGDQTPAAAKKDSKPTPAEKVVSEEAAEKPKVAVPAKKAAAKPAPKPAAKESPKPASSKAEKAPAAKKR